MRFERLREACEVSRPPSSETSALYRSILIIGLNEDIDSGTLPEDITNNNSATIYWPSEALQLEISSDSGNDTLGGTGANILLLEGLNSDWEEITELVYMNGTNTVTTSNSFLRLNYARNVFSGSLNTTAGNITINHNSTELRYIKAGKSFHTTAAYSVPVKHNLYLTSVNIGVQKNASNVAAEVDTRVFVEATNTDYFGTTYPLTRDAPVDISPNPHRFSKIPPKSDLYYQCTYVSSANDTQIQATVSGILLKDEGA